MQIQRATIMELYHEDIISEKTFSELATELDIELDDPGSSWSELLHQ